MSDKQGNIGGLRELGSTKSKFRFPFCKQLSTWLIDVRAGCPFHSCLQHHCSRRCCPGCTARSGVGTRVGAGTRVGVGTWGGTMMTAMPNPRLQAQRPAGADGAKVEQRPWSIRAWPQRPAGPNAQRGEEVWHRETSFFQTCCSGCPCVSSPQVARQQQQP